MKKTLLTILIPFIIIITAFILIFSLTNFIEEPLYIAVAGPMNLREGKEMLKGVNLYCEEINRKGGIAGRKLELMIFNDKNDTRMALKKASEISYTNALLVIGHYSSLASIAAGELYKKNRIPAITASATAESVTFENELYFRIVPTNRFISLFIADYIKKVLNKSSAIIIFDEDTYGTSLAKAFEKNASELGINIKRKWSFNTNDKKLDDEFRDIIAGVRTMDEPEVIFLATHAAEGVKLLTSLKYPGAKYSIIGPDSFSTLSFIEELRMLPREQTIPGYYSNGVYTISPFIADIADKSAFRFRREYIRKYNEKPSWVAACYYDVMHLVADAIERAEIQGNIRDNRRSVREALARYNSYEVAVRGISAHIYFDKNGDVKRPLAMGVYENQKLFPLFWQYQAIPPEDVFKNKITILEGMPMTKTQVVYAGIDINEISDLDFKNSICTMDFYIWFRFEGDFDDKDIIFKNSVRPIKLDHPVVETSAGNITTRAYHVKADFKNNFDFRAYPFGSQVMRVVFRHAHQVRNSLIYVPDTLGLKVSGDNSKKIKAVSPWKVDEFFYQDIDSIKNPLKDIPYSQFNVAIRIKKHDPGFIVKTFFPIFAMAVILYFIYLVPSYRLGIRTLIFMGVLITITPYHMIFALYFTVNYLLAIEYAFFMIYLLALTTIVLSLITYKLHKLEKKKQIKLYILAGKTIHIIIMLSAGFLFTYIYYTN